MFITSQHCLTFPAINKPIEISLCTLLLFITAQASIPLYPVPITLQTLGIMIIGLCFSYKTALYSVMTYLFLGLMGFPVFSNFSGGYGIFLGPRGGYLIGFLAAIVVMNSVKESLKYTYSQTTYNTLACMAGMMMIYIPGISWLAVHVGIHDAIMVGLFPFIIPGMIKICLLVNILRHCNQYGSNLR